MKRSLCVVILCLSSLMLIFGASAQQQPMYQAPAPLSLNEALVMVHVGNVTGFLDQAGLLAQKIEPSMNGAALKSMVGMYLNDPSLAGMPGDSGALIAIFGTGMMTFLEVQPDQASAYTSALSAQGMAAETASSLLVSSRNPSLMQGAKILAPQAKVEMAKRRAGSNIQATVHMDRVLAQMGPQIQGMLSMMESMQSNPMSRVGFRAFYLAAQEVTQLDLDLSPGAEGLAAEFVVLPKAGSSLSQFFAAPTQSVDGLMNYLPSNGAVRGVFAINADAYASLMENLAGQAFEQLGTPQQDRDAVMNMLRNSSMMQGNASAVDMFTPGGSLFTGSQIYKVENPEQATELMEQSMEQVKQMFQGQQQTDVEMSFDFQKNAREYKGIPIHKLNMKVEGPEVQGALADFQYEMAVVKDYVVNAMGSSSVEKLIDAVQSGSNPEAKDLTAKSEYSGADAYIDIDLGRLMESLASSMGQMAGQADTAQMDAMGQAFAGARPVTMGAFMDAGAARLKFDVPAGIVSAIGNMNRQMQGGGAPMQ
ncbi:hypothetical protein HQ520_06705 [bacterium]|nr:hypothetical protein [bacterium]